jgi:predicted RNA-binding protein with PUA-like domain
MTHYWLMKSEPDAFSIDDLKRQKTTGWDGVRNYQARNMMRDDFSVGDKVLFYHSNCTIPGIVGIAEVVKKGYPDDTAFDPRSKYFDPKSPPEHPRWYRVDVKFIRKFGSILSLSELKQTPALSNMWVLRKGSRLSITPVSAEEWKIILSIAK